MDSVDLDASPARAGLRTLTALVFLAAFAVIASWLFAYGVPNAVAGAKVGATIGGGGGRDLRPMRMLTAFAVLFGGLAVAGFVFRWLTRRSLRKIDASADEPEG